MFKSTTITMKTLCKKNRKRREMYDTNAKNIPKDCSLELEFVTDGVEVAIVDSVVDFTGAKTNCKEKVSFNQNIIYKPEQLSSDSAEQDLPRQKKKKEKKNYKHILYSTIVHI